MPNTSFLAGLKKTQDVLRTYRVLIVFLLFLGAIAGSSRYLRGSLIDGPVIPDPNTPAGQVQSLRTCDSEGTVFENLENIDEVRELYLQYVSAVVDERETVYRTPSAWKCGRGGEPESPLLEALAALMPGWYENIDTSFLFGSITVPTMKPVTFDSFSAVLGEFQREYECKLTELQDRTIAEVSRNEDVSKPAQFCCVADALGLGCRAQTDATFCVTPLTDNPQCNDACSVMLTTYDLASRAPIFHADAKQERITSRAAMERTLQTMRSFDTNYAIARQLICYERASLDLKNEMGLLADAISCMPKIWDALTSIHDTK